MPPLESWAEIVDLFRAALREFLLFEQRSSNVDQAVLSTETETEPRSACGHTMTWHTVKHFLNLLDSSHVSIWERTRGMPLCTYIYIKNKMEREWMNLLSITFKQANQLYLLPVRGQAATAGGFLLVRRREKGDSVSCALSPRGTLWCTTMSD